MSYPFAKRKRVIVDLFFGPHTTEENRKRNERMIEIVKVWVEPNAGYLQVPSRGGYYWTYMKKGGVLPSRTHFKKPRRVGLSKEMVTMVKAHHRSGTEGVRRHARRV